MELRKSPQRLTLAVVLLALALLLLGCKEKSGGGESVYGWTAGVQRDLTATVTSVELELTSQKWQDIVWKHRLYVLAPKNLTNPETALLVITGSGRAEVERMLGAGIASVSGSPVAILCDVPNQPLFDNLEEDALIAYTFAKYLETRDKRWPLLLPMRESAVRAMDALQEFARKEWKKEIKKFVVTGASKRGWTTWLTAASDKRVAAIAPMVYDNLNLAAQMARQKEAFGDYSEMIEDYTALGLPDLVASPEGQEIAALVDPYAFRERLTMPKLIIIGSNDPYWPLDASNLYWDELMGEKYILRVPNKGHDVGDVERLVNAQLSFFLHASGRLAYPKLEWAYSASQQGTRLTLTSDLPPEAVRVWLASAPTLDFRKATWSAQPMVREGKGWTYTLQAPESGYAAMFAEAVYPYLDNRRFYLSTQVKIIPQR